MNKFVITKELISYDSPSNATSIIVVESELNHEDFCTLFSDKLKNYAEKMNECSLESLRIYTEYEKLAGDNEDFDYTLPEDHSLNVKTQENNRKIDLIVLGEVGVFEHNGTKIFCGDFVQEMQNTNILLPFKVFTLEKWFAQKLTENKEGFVHPEAWRQLSVSVEHLNSCLL